jgi:hypothetical protein
MFEFFKTDVGKVVLGGVLVGTVQLIISLIALIKEVWFHKSKRRGEAQYLAMRLVLVFDQLVNDCSKAVHDRLTRDGGGFTQSTEDDPALLLPTDGDYKALPRHLMFRALSMPSKVDGIKEGLRSVWEFSDAPDYDDFYEYRREHWSKLGLEALQLIDALCRAYKIPAPDRPEHYSPREAFLKKLVEVEQGQKNRAEAQRKMMASMNANLPKVDASSGL